MTLSGIFTMQKCELRPEPGENPYFWTNQFLWKLADLLPKTPGFSPLRAS